MLSCAVPLENHNSYLSMLPWSGFRNPKSTTSVKGSTKSLKLRGLHNFFLGWTTAKLENHVSISMQCYWKTIVRERRAPSFQVVNKYALGRANKSSDEQHLININFAGIPRGLVVALPSPFSAQSFTSQHCHLYRRRHGSCIIWGCLTNQKCHFETFSWTVHDLRWFFYHKGIMSTILGPLNLQSSRLSKITKAIMV